MDKTLKRANRAIVRKQDILRFVQEMAKRDAPADRDFEARTLLLARMCRDPDVALAIEFRMEALARLMEGNNPKGWTLPPGPDGAVLTAEPVFAATAMQPLIELNGRPAFEREAFFNKVLELASADGNA